MDTASDVWLNGIPAVGQKAQRSRLVTSRDIELFTEMSGDRNPLHYDEEAARATRFGGIVVQGGVTSAILNATVAEDLPELPHLGCGTLVDNHDNTRQLSQHYERHGGGPRGWRQEDRTLLCSCGILNPKPQVRTTETSGGVGNGELGVIRRMLGGKIHRVTVTDANLEYEGSVTIDRDLLDAAGILEGEAVEVWDVTNGARLTTYALCGPRASGVVCINGAAAHLVHPGDLVIIANFVTLDDTEARSWRPRVVFVDSDNRFAEKRSERQFAPLGQRPSEGGDLLSAAP